MLAVLSLLAVREVTSHATRSLLTGAGVAIGCAVVVAVLALNHSVLDGFQGMVNTLAGGADLQVRGGQAGVPADLVDKVAQDPAVAAAGAYLEAWILDPATGERVLLVGVDFLAEGMVPADPLAYLDPVVITKEGGEGRQSSAEARAHLEKVLSE